MVECVTKHGWEHECEKIFFSGTGDFKHVKFRLGIFLPQLTRWRSAPPRSRGANDAVKNDAVANTTVTNTAVTDSNATLNL